MIGFLLAACLAPPLYDTSDVHCTQAQIDNCECYRTIQCSLETGEAEYFQILRSEPGRSVIVGNTGSAFQHCLPGTESDCIYDRIVAAYVRWCREGVRRHVDEVRARLGLERRSTSPP